VMFRVVLCPVPGLFYVKCLERRMFHGSTSFPAHAYRGHGGHAGDQLSMHGPGDVEHVEHVEQKLFSITYRVPCLSWT
jgi:hypothetical protein